MKRAILAATCLAIFALVVATPAAAQPTISAVTNDGPVSEGASATIVVAATGTGTLSYEFDCDNDTAFEVGPQPEDSASCAFGDDGSFVVPVRVTDDAGSSTDSTTVIVANADPAITSVVNDGPIVEGGSATITVTATDVAADTLSYSFDCNGDTFFEVGPQPGNSTSCAFVDDGSFPVGVQVDDEDGGSAPGSTTVTVTNADPALTVDNATVTVDEDDPASNSGTFSDLGDDTVTVTASVGSITQDTGSSGNWSWSFATTDGPDETQVVTITGTDGEGGSGSVTFQLNVDNVAPTGEDDDYDTDEDTQLVVAAPGVLDNDTDPGDDTLSATAQTAAATAQGGTVTLASDGSFTYDPPADFFGSDSFGYEVCDEDTDCGNATATIEVAPVNDAPAFAKGADETVDEDASAQTVLGWATGIVAGPANESDQSVSFSVTGNTNPALFSAVPAVAPNGDLTYTPAANRSGFADVTITLSDDCGGGSPPASCGAGGIGTSGPQTFRITVNDVNDAPSFTPGGDVTLEAGSGERSTPWATNVSVGPVDESNQTPAFVVTAVGNPSLFVAGPFVDPNGTLRFTPVGNATGSSAITVKLTDDGGTVNGGVDESAPVTFTLTLVASSKPVANPQSVQMNGGNPLSITLTGSDPDNQTPLSFRVVPPVLDVDTGAIISSTGPFRGTLNTSTPPTNPGGLSANVVYTPKQPPITRSVILATESVLISKFADVLSGDVVVNGAAGVGTIERSTSTPAGFAIRANTLNVDSLAAINGSAFCNFGFASCAPLTLPVYDRLPPFLVGSVKLSSPIIVPFKGTVSVTPGLYGTVNVDRDGTLVFAPGKYSMQSLTTGNKAVLQFSGPTELRIAGRMELGSYATVNLGGPPSNVVFYVAGTDGPTGTPAAIVGFNNANFLGNVYAPNGTVSIGQDSFATGAFLGKRVVVNNKAKVALGSGFREPPDQFAFDVTDTAGLESSAAIVQINEEKVCRNDAGQVAALAAFAGRANTDGAASIAITLRGCESTDVPVTFALVQNGGQGSVTGLPSGPVGPPYEFNVTYTPADPVPNKRDSFIFSISNGVSTQQATVKINEPPCNAVQAFTTSSFVATNEDNPLTITLSACDPDDGVPTFSTSPGPSGSFPGCSTCAISAPVAITDNRPGITSVNVVFTHSEVVAKSTSFSFTATAASGADTANVTVEVNPKNLAPVANDDGFSGGLGGVITGNVLANDSDPNGDALTATLVTPPGFAGSFTLNPNGAFVYTHNGTANFSDSFVYSASDGALSDTATVSITILAATINVTVSKSGPAGSAASLITSDPAGIDCGSVCSATFTTTESIRLSVLPAPGFVFNGWSGDADCLDGQLQPLANRSCTANFLADAFVPPSGDPISVTVVKAGSGAGRVASSPAGIDCGVGCPSQTATITGDPRITLFARAAPGSVFAGFTGGPGISANDCEDSELEAAVNTTCTATFNLAPRTLTIQFFGAGGSVASSPPGIGCAGEPCSAIFANGVTVTLAGRPDSGVPSEVTFGGDCAPDATFNTRATVEMMNTDKICTVTFN